MTRNEEDLLVALIAVRFWLEIDIRMAAIICDRIIDLKQLLPAPNKEHNYAG